MVKRKITMQVLQTCGFPKTNRIVQFASETLRKDARWMAAMGLHANALKSNLIGKIFGT